jgi:hypothetical protein
MREHSFVTWRASAALGLIATALLPLAAGGSPRADTTENARTGGCFGLACAKPGRPYYVPEAHGSVPFVGTVKALDEQKTAGFYAFGRHRSVAYVVPRHQAEQIPPSVRNLPTVRSIARPGGHPGFDFGTLVIFDPGAVLTVPQSVLDGRGKGRWPATRGSGGTGCDNRHFCLWDYTDFVGRGIEFGPEFKEPRRADGWKPLSRFDFNDKANSMHNNRNKNSFLAEHWTGRSGGGTQYCAEERSEDSWLGNNPIDRNEASAFALLRTSALC